MKIKTDFVTNSSSTCYVVMTKGEFTLESFLKASGIEETSPFRTMFETLFNSLSSFISPLETGVKKHRWYKDRCTSTEEFIKVYFSNETWERIQKARKEGFEVYIGELSSEENEIETFFCTSSFVIESDSLIIDASCDGW